MIQQSTIKILIKRKRPAKAEALTGHFIPDRMNPLEMDVADIPQNSENSKPAQNDAPGPSGVIAVFISPDGRVIASHACFNRSQGGGISDTEWQTRYARDGLAFRALEAMCHSDIAKALSGYYAGIVCRELEERLGYRTEIIEIEP